MNYGLWSSTALQYIKMGWLQYTIGYFEAIYCGLVLSIQYIMYTHFNICTCSLPLRRVHEIKHTYLVFRTHGLFITWKPSSGVIRSCPPWSQVASKLSPQYPGKWGGGMCSGWRGQIPAPLFFWATQGTFPLHNNLFCTIH